MEDYVTSLDVFAPLLFFNLSWKKDDAVTKAMFERQWSSLRRALMCIFRPETSKSLASQAKKYEENIHAYAEAVQEVLVLFHLYRPRGKFASSLYHSTCVQAYQGTANATIKLHLAWYHVVHLMITHGFLDKFQEYWVERMVGDISDCIHGNARQKPEATYVRVHLCRVGAVQSRYANRVSSLAGLRCGCVGGWVCLWQT